MTAGSGTQDPSAGSGPGPVIAVLGAGTVGSTLATGWARAGHRVILGSRDPDAVKVRDAVDNVLANAGGNATGGAVSAAKHREATAKSAVVVIAVPGDQVPHLIDTLGDALRGKVVIDATNNTTGPAMNSIEPLKSAGAVAFRVFNTVGWEQMHSPVFGTLRADMLYAGPAGEADAVVAQLITDIGFRPIPVGDGADAVAAVDALARLWFLLAFRQGHGRRVGFRILTGQDDAAA